MRGHAHALFVNRSAESNARPPPVESSRTKVGHTSEVFGSGAAAIAVSKAAAGLFAQKDGLKVRNYGVLPHLARTVEMLHFQ